MVLGECVPPPGAADTALDASSRPEPSRLRKGLRPFPRLTAWDPSPPCHTFLCVVGASGLASGCLKGRALRHGFGGVRAPAWCGRYRTRCLEPPGTIPFT